MGWVDQELACVAMGDERLDKRAKQLLKRMIAQPTTSLPVACRGWAETQAAYRFFDNKKVTAEKVLAPHQEATRVRMAEHSVVLCVQDTSELDYTSQPQMRGLGPLGFEYQQGLLIHPTVAITPDRLTLGVLKNHIWSRDNETFGKREYRASKPIEEKESYRWVEGYQQVCRISETLPDTQCVYVADRESNIYELFVEAEQQENAADFLVRVRHDRIVTDDSRLSEKLAHAPVLGEATFELPSTHSRKRKPVTQHLKAVRVELRPPKNKIQKLSPVTVAVILAEEVRPPTGEKPITWILITNLPITASKQVLEKLQWYLCRWQIEIFFRILKSGCKVEELQFECPERLQPALTMYMIVAWRILYLTLLGRECPDLPCDLVFETKERQAIYLVSIQTHAPDKIPTLNTILRMIASMGGFLNRKGDGDPQTIWIGLQRTQDFVLALDAHHAARAP
ncbi:MAG: IS4 family transposase [Granulosicoccus sp.]